MQIDAENLAAKLDQGSGGNGSTPLDVTDVNEKVTPNAGAAARWGICSSSWRLSYLGTMARSFRSSAMRTLRGEVPT